MTIGGLAVCNTWRCCVSVLSVEASSIMASSADGDVMAGVWMASDPSAVMLDSTEAEL